LNLSEYISNRVVQLKVEHVFMVTGGGAMHLNDAFSRNKDLTCYCFHHEQSAAIAAEGYARTSNKIAVVNVTSGPGGINALNGVYGAYVDSIPMVIISGQVKQETIAKNFSSSLRQLGDQEVDIISMVKPITKYSVALENSDDIFEVINKAFFIAKNGRPGPVWIDIPINLQSAEIGKVPDSIEDFGYSDIIKDKNFTINTFEEFNYLSEKALDSMIEKSFEKLISSERPVIMVGSGVRISGMADVFIKLIAKLGLPVISAWNAQDVISYYHENYCGLPGTVGDRAGNITLQNADFLLILGCRLNIRQISYNWKAFAPDAYKVMVDIDKSELEKHTLDIDLKIHALLQEFIPKLSEKANSYNRSYNQERFLNWCKEKLCKYDPVIENKSASNKINPYQFFDTLFKTIPTDSIVVSANGSACVMGFQAGKVRGKQRFFTNSGAASMGYDLPAAIGASISKNKKNVICLAGDGSIMMNLQELATIVGYNLPIKIFIINNSGYHSIKQTQENYFPDNIYGTDSSNGVNIPNFINLAKGFSIESVEINSIEQLKTKTIKKKIIDDRPYIFDVKVDPNQPFSPKLISQKLANGEMVSPRLENMWPFLSKSELEDNIFK